MTRRTAKPKKSPRVAISADITRKLLIESGFRCSVPRCDGQWPTLEFHHIDEDPSNSVFENLIVLCPTHHAMAGHGGADRKLYATLKKLLGEFAHHAIPDIKIRRSRILYSLMSELYGNLNVLNMPIFNASEEPPQIFVVYPRFYHVVLDSVLASGLFIHEQDRKLYRLLFAWSQRAREMNQRLGLVENTLINRPNPEEHKQYHRELKQGPVLQTARQTLVDLVNHIFEFYSGETGIDRDTVFFADD